MAKKRSNIRKSNNPISRYLRLPSVQIGLGVFVVLLIIIMIYIGNSNKSAALAAEINTAQAYQMYQQKTAFFVDVREQAEWDSFHIPGTTLIPLGTLADRLQEVPKDQQVVVVCRSGNRSVQGRDILKQAGYTNVTSMSGGVNDWKAKGYPIEP
ncbi:MAG: rhodanese-like domain-containing protein [Chloroflexi bacterium]|nr:rhodanese-like domain-containing protein [Chloroflexota bacterium]